MNKEKITYGIIEETYAANTRSRTAYGVAALDGTADQHMDTVLHSIHDISPDRAELAAFVDLCNREQLSPDHLDDAVDDFIER